MDLSSDSGSAIVTELRTSYVSNSRFLSAEKDSSNGLKSR